MTRIIPWLMLGISITAGFVDIFNVGNTFTNGQSWQQEGLVFLVRIVLALLVAALAWVAPIAFGHAAVERLRGDQLFWLVMILISTTFNMACSKAYVGRTWKPVEGVSSAITIYVPTTNVIAYQSDDWFRDAVAFYPNFILLSMVAVNLERKQKLSPEEVLRQTREEIERQKIVRLRREQLNPLLAENAEHAAAGFTGRVRGSLKGLTGIELPQRKPKTPQEEAQERTQEAIASGEDAEDTTPSEGVIQALTPEDLTPAQVAIILSAGMPRKPGQKAKKLTDRTIRARCARQPNEEGYIPAHKLTISGHNVWIIKRDDLAAAYPKEWEAHERNEKTKARVRHNRRRGNGDQAQEPIAIYQNN